MAKRAVLFGAVLGAIAVMAGAFGAHGLEKTLEPKMLANWEIAVRYQMYHALALLFVGLLVERWGATGPLRAAELAFGAGTVLFSGALYAYALTGLKFLVAFAPIGGTLQIVGWIALAVAAAKRKAV